MHDPSTPEKQRVTSDAGGRRTAGLVLALLVVFIGIAIAKPWGSPAASTPAPLGSLGTGAASVLPPSPTATGTAVPTPAAPTPAGPSIDTFGTALPPPAPAVALSCPHVVPLQRWSVAPLPLPLPLPPPRFRHFVLPLPGALGRRPPPPPFPCDAAHVPPQVCPCPSPFPPFWSWLLQLCSCSSLFFLISGLFVCRCRTGPLSFFGFIPGVCRCCLLRAACAQASALIESVQCIISSSCLSTQGNITYFAASSDSLKMYPSTRIKMYPSTRIIIIISNS